MLGDFPRTVTAAGVKAAKLDGVLRYWPKQSGSSVVVGLTKAEIADLSHADVPFATIYEAASASWMSGGRAVGVQAGKWLTTLFAGTGHTPRAVYLAADANTLSSAAVNACLDGAASVLGKAIVGLYGFLPELRSAHDGGHASWFWMAGHYLAPSTVPWIHLYQCQGSQPPQYPTNVIVSGQSGDGDIEFRSDWGQTTMTSPQQLWQTNLTDGSLTQDPFHMLAYLYEVTQGTIVPKVNAVAGQIGAEQVALVAAVNAADADTRATISAAVKGVQTGTIDPAAFAAVVAPLVAAADVAAFKAQFER